MNKPKSFQLSGSPLVPKLKQTLKIRKISCSPLKDPEDSRIQLKISESQQKFSKIFPKIANKKVSSSLNFSVSQESNDSHNLVDFESENLRIEQVLRKKLRKENDFVKKFEVVLNTFEKLSRLGRNFYIFHSVLKEFFNQFRNFLVFTEDKEALVKELEGKVEEMSKKNEELEEEVRKCCGEVKGLKEELEKLRGENKSLKPMVKKQSLLLNKLKDEGYPLEKLYDSLPKSSTKSKSMNKISLQLTDSEKRPSSIPIKGQVPKLKFTHLEENEGYQEEFMAKFNEFSESWRKQIMKDHSFKNK
jgi:hypothetical protein